LPKYTEKLTNACASYPIQGSISLGDQPPASDEMIILSLK